MTVCEVRPQRAQWIVTIDRRELSTHPTADEAVRAAQSALAQDPDPAEIYVRDSYSRTHPVSVPRR
jgi:hypothetical protein